MIADNYTNKVYFSSLLKTKYPILYKEVINNLGNLNIPYELIFGTKDIWCRDYMPVQVGRNEYIQFNYSPSYLKYYPDLKSRVNIKNNNSNIIVRQSDIILDGGNVVKSNDKVILTDMIFKENINYSSISLIKELENLFQAEVTIISSEPDDLFGHSDGILRFYDDKTLLINDYSKIVGYKSYANKLYGDLASKGFNLILVPYSVDNVYTNDGVCSAKGNYINYLQIENTILLPAYDDSELDKQSFILFERMFGKNIIQINCTELASKGGGVLNCISWNVFENIAPGKNNMKSEDPSTEKMFRYVMDKVPFRLFVEEYVEVENAFRHVWNLKTSNYFGDVDFKNAVYKFLEPGNRNYLIPQNIVDGVVDQLLNYLISTDKYGFDFSNN